MALILGSNSVNLRLIVFNSNLVKWFLKSGAELVRSGNHMACKLAVTFGFEGCQMPAERGVWCDGILTWSEINALRGGGTFETMNRNLSLPC